MSKQKYKEFYERHKQYVRQYNEKVIRHSLILCKKDEFADYAEKVALKLFKTSYKLNKNDSEKKKIEKITKLLLAILKSEKTLKSEYNLTHLSIQELLDELR